VHLERPPSGGLLRKEETCPKYEIRTVCSQRRYRAAPDRSIVHSNHGRLQRILHSPPQSLDENVVHRSTLAIHAKRL